MDITRDEHSSKGLGPEESAQVIGRITEADADRERTPGQWSGVTMSSSSALEIPTFDRGWHPNEIAAWLTGVENDETTSDADLARARRAVSDALGVDA